jgi:3-methyladenine DNA glycosylase/8-oxoguanine DNA glycosylase
MQINPTKITNFERSDAELQAFWLFCIFVAGKNADRAGRCVGKLLSHSQAQYPNTPFSYLASLGETGIHNVLVCHRVGQYARITRAILESLSLDLRDASAEELQGVFGVGPKTARFFILHSRRSVNVAVLDTHILRWMREHGIEDAPKSTPPRAKYAHFESLFLCLANVYFPHLSTAEVDLLIWCQYSGRFDGEEFPEPVLPAELQSYS